MILVTGGAGYIGSHTLHMLRESREEVIVLDNLYSGFRWAVPEQMQLVEGDVADQILVESILKRHRIKSVIHFAAHLDVNESIRDPFKYYRNNTLGSLNLIDSCQKNGVENFIFSSTCAVYGSPENNPVDENAATSPVNPYGSSKLFTENLLRDLTVSHTSPMKYVVLRYFNVAGAAVRGGIGQATRNATQLVKVACEVASGQREKLLVYGTDYPTIDGTCVRDYIHVDDLALAHLAALSYLRSGGESEIFNCGYGKGYSVMQIAETLRRVSGVSFPVVPAPRRAGDATAIWADARKITDLLKWQPRYDDIDLICRTAWEWENFLQKQKSV